jgi:hypothetical protein
VKELFLIATGQDTAGWNWRIHDGFRQHAKTWLTRSMAATQTYLEYPEDLRYDSAFRDGLYQRADAIHLQNQVAGWELYDQGHGKPTVLQHHGTIFRESHESLARVARRIGMLQICSTLDLTLLEPDVEWVPVPYRRSDLETIRATEYRPTDRIVVAHAPTNRSVKGTEHFLDVMRSIAARRHVSTLLIETRPWAECLRAKAQADIYYDQLELGYGSNAVEAWGMGIPVVGGVADPTVRAAMMERWGRLPFFETTTETLEANLEILIRNASAREEYAAIGSEHFDRWHDETILVPQMEEIYSAARRTRPGPVRIRRRR